MEDVRVNGHTILENVPAIINTSADFIIGDRERVSELYRQLGGSFIEHAGIRFYYREF
jgi:hypothetical protein